MAVGSTFTDSARTEHAQLRQRPVVVQGRAQLQGGHQHPLQPRPEGAVPELVPERDRPTPRGSAASAGATCPAAPSAPSPLCSQLPAVATAGQAGYADSWINILGVITQSTQRANYDRRRHAAGARTRRSRARSASRRVRVVRPGQLAAPLEPHAHRGRALQPVFAALRSERPAGGADHQHGRSGSTSASQNMAERHPVERAARSSTFDLAGPANNKPGFYAWDKNNFAPRVAVAWSPTRRGRLPAHAHRRRRAWSIRGGYTKVFDRVGLGLATNFDEGFAFGMSTTISSPFGAARTEENPAVAVRRARRRCRRPCRRRHPAGSRRRRRAAPASSRRASTTR